MNMPNNAPLDAYKLLFLVGGRDGGGVETPRLVIGFDDIMALV